MAKGIALAGNIVVDTDKRVDDYPARGMLATILSVSRMTGGAVPNMGIDLKRMDAGQLVKGVGLVGEDEAGSFALDVMTAAGMDISGVQKVPGRVTSFTDVMTANSTGERTLFTMQGVSAEFGPEHVDFDALSDCSVFHLAYALLLDRLDGPDPEYGTLMARVLHEATLHGLTTSMDVVSGQGDRFAAVVTPSLPHCDYLIVNEIESSRIAGILSRDASGELLADNIFPICRVLLDKGVRKLVAVHAPEGGWCVEKDGRQTFRPSLALPKGYIKGTVGAGDAFCAGMLYELNRGSAVKRALDIAAGAAACVLGCPNGFGLKPLEEIERMLEQYPRRKLGE